MKKIIFTLIVILTTMNLFSQTHIKKSEGSTTDKIQFEENSTSVYQLFPTQNMWTFIKLNTRNGQMWQVQFDTKASNRFQSELNLTPLVTKENEKNNRFTLYSTQNMYNFILLDQLDGKTWQVQWSLDSENRLILPIR